jgi:hypothetical protein
LTYRENALSAKLRRMASTMPGDTERTRPYSGNEAGHQEGPTIQEEVRGRSGPIGGIVLAGPVMNKTDGAVDRDAEGDPCKKRKKAGSAEEGDEAGEKGRRPCDMCRKRKVSTVHVVAGIGILG